MQSQILSLVLCYVIYTSNTINFHFGKNIFQLFVWINFLIKIVNLICEK